ncbi:tetratricopeptide repeat-containing sensor histidine kinase [Pedobacter caeni]|uniref:histidine kinase n=1 Tax=Pedobacter caeni TaxID=288992 RepID=A0A1M4VXX9_9SPHI|nr:sensor histidine kinase [Pedobacter caeni]SHE73713.1 Histidine kinase-, DNA gyrase B-, and HSP90-like ATPase [Pedobacter caeni]
MTRFFYTLLLLGILITGLKAQQPAKKISLVDSLKGMLEQKIPDSLRARTNFNLAEQLLYADTLQSNNYLEQGRKLIKKNAYLQAIYYYYAATLESRTDLHKSEVSFKKAHALLAPFKTEDAYLLQAKSWHNYGVLQQLKDNYRGMADALLNKAIPYAIKSGDKAYLAVNYMDLSLVFKNNKQFEKAQIYIDSTLQILQKVKGKKSYKIVAYHTAAENYVFLKKYPQAKAMLDSASVLLSPNPESPLYLDYYFAEGLYFDDVKQYDQAIISLDKGIEMALKLQARNEEQRLLMQKLHVLRSQRKFDKALSIANYLLKQKDMLFLSDDRLLVYTDLAETWSGLGNMSEAYKWMKTASLMRDSINKSRLEKDVHELEIKYKKAENQREIGVLKATNEKAALSVKNNRLLAWLLGSVALFLLIISFFGLLYFRNSKKLTKQEEINYRQRLKELEQDKQLTISNAMLEGEERERQRVGRDLHDGLGGTLAGIKINLSDVVANTSPAGKDTELGKIIAQLDNSVNDLRSIARNLMPETLLKFGLETALKDLCETFNNNGLKITLQLFDIQESMEISMKINIYRIIQEILSNTVRHSGASQLLLQCSQNESVFLITAEDNGKGFDPESANHTKGIGLDNIRNRVALLHGKMELNSAINEGTAINIELHVGE